MMLNFSAESIHPCFVPDLAGKVFNHSHLRMMLAIGFCEISFIMLKNFTLILRFLRGFAVVVVDINTYWFLSNIFSTSI